MRVTTNMTMRNALHDLTRSMNRMRDSSADVSTGKSIRKISDDPLRGMEALRTRGALRRAEQRRRVADDAETRLQIADTALVGALDLMPRAKELAVRASSTGASDPASRAAIATELEGLRDELLAIANTEHRGQPVFSGTAAGPAYDPASGVYLGNAERVTRDVAEGITINPGMPGEQVFGDQAAPTGDLFAVIERLAAAAAIGDVAAIEAEHTNLDEAVERLGAATARMGSRAARLDGIRMRANAQEAGLREHLSLTEDVDIAESLIALKADENAYQASLQATARVLVPSLLDYLR